jgi:hypothetical protein
MNEPEQNGQLERLPTALEREERRLERLRLVSQLSVPAAARFADEENDYDDPGPQAA